MLPLHYPSWTGRVYGCQSSATVQERYVGASSRTIRNRPIVRNLVVSIVREGV